MARLARLNQRAGQLMADYIAAHGTRDTDALIAYAYALVTKYGEGSAELACQMYDALAAAAKAGVPAAEPAQPASYGEVARMVQATKASQPQMQQGVSRLVKRAGADTTLKNALRDGAELAWVPQGDTCAFCHWQAAAGRKPARQPLKADTPSTSTPTATVSTRYGLTGAAPWPGTIRTSTCASTVPLMGTSTNCAG